MEKDPERKADGHTIPLFAPRNVPVNLSSKAKLLRLLLPLLHCLLPQVPAPSMLTDRDAEALETLYLDSLALFEMAPGGVSVARVGALSRLSIVQAGRR